VKFPGGVSAFTFVVGVLSGVVIQWVLALDAPFYVKALCVSLLVLSVLLLFANDVDKMRLKESMKT